MKRPICCTVALVLDNYDSNSNTFLLLIIILAIIHPTYDHGNSALK